MCGIAGWYRRRGRPVAGAVIAAQCAAIRHRGPDDEGLFTDGDFGFGMRRLSVVDVQGGHQPMRTQDGRYSIVFNGEVYNFAELRTELEAAGRRFHSRSDTEVVLEAFAEWGDAAWPRLEGMFAVAVWDHVARRLHLARDPLGIKPLYWSLQDDAFAFASELKALGPVPGLLFEPLPEAIDQYLALGAVLAPRSIYRQVFKLEPGCSLTVAAEGPPQAGRYWQLELRERPGFSDAEWVEQCRSLLLETVRRHLVADVPLGAFLSGGVDSAAVVAAMSRLTGEPVRAFTIGFDEPRFDESADAARAAAHLGCRHTLRRLAPGQAGAMLEQLAPMFDEPFADASAIPTWYVSQLAREQVTVALSGDGGDELFAGYRRHRSELMLQRLRRVPGFAAALASLQWLPAGGPVAWQRQRARLLKIAGDSRLDSTTRRFLAKQCNASPQARTSLYSDDFAAQLTTDDALARWDAELFGGQRSSALPADPVDRLLHADTTVWLADDMLTKVDRASMAHSLEVRVPMLSHRFVEWAAGVPQRLKLDAGQGKIILRRAIEPWLPPGYLERPKKGFAPPLSIWLAGDFGAHVLRVWRGSGVEDSGIFRRAALDSLVAEHRAGQADHAQRLYGLMMFAYWWQHRLGAAAPISRAPAASGHASCAPQPA